MPGTASDHSCARPVELPDNGVPIEAFSLRTPVIRGALLTNLAITVLSMPINLFP
jgi:hypothetical protein